MTIAQMLTKTGVLSFVAGETTVSEYLLLEDENFLELARTAETPQQLVDWVNENY